MRVGGCVRPTPRSRVYSRPPHTRSAPSPEALGPARRALRCGVPQGHTTWLGVGRRGSTGGFRGCRAGALCTPFASPTAGPAIRRLDGLVRRPRLCLWAPCAHPLARRPRVLVARQHEVSEPTSLTCVHGCGRGRGCRITRLGRMERVLSSCSLCDAVERRVGVRGQKQRAWLCRAGRRRGQIWGVLGACRGVAGDVPGRWPGRRHARITQRRHVGELEPELYFLGVGG